MHTDSVQQYVPKTFMKSNRIIRAMEREEDTLILSNKIWVNENLNGILWQAMRVPECNLYV